jgi:membrane dipeptidase
LNSLRIRALSFARSYTILFLQPKLDPNLFMLRSSLTLTLAAFLLCAYVSAQSAPASTPISAHARALQDSAIVVDTHADTPQRFLDSGFDIGNTDPADTGQISLDKARAGNLGAEFFSIWVDPETVEKENYAKRAFDLIDSVYQQAARHPDRMMMAYSVADIERAHREKKLAALMGVEGGHAIEDDLHLLRDFYQRLGRLVRRHQRSQGPAS